MSLDSTASKDAISADTFREQLADQLWKGLVWIAIIGPPFSAVRMLATGWRWIYAVHFFLGLVVVFSYIMRHKLNAKLKAALAITVPFCVGLPALLTFGFYSAAVAWIAVSCVAAAMFCRQRLVLTIVGVEMSCIALVGVGFSQEYFVAAVNHGDVIPHFFNWMPIFFGTSVAVITLTFGINTYNESIRSLLHSVEVQRDEIAKQRDIIHHQATHDPLTGLPTLRLARDRLEMACSQARRDKDKAAVFFIDLDGFKAANDCFGHDAGDHVLKTIAARLLDSIRIVDTAARLGGDEFIVIMFGIENIEDTKQVAEKLIKVIAEPIYYEERLVSIGSSIGIAVFPDHASSAEEMLKHADEAMYAVKKSAKNNYAVYAERALKTG